MEYYPETDTEAMELAYEYGEITTLTDFDVPIHDIQMEENMEKNLEEITTELSVVTISEDKKKKNKYGPEQIRRFIEILQEEGISSCGRKKMHDSVHLKQASKYNAERDSERTLRLRQELVSKWKEICVDFQKNCVFIDEAGFNSQMMRGRAWSRVGEPAKVKVHSRKGVNISIIGCISPFGTINLSKVEPL
ncbi:hypothetical protein G6F70_000065 [Rhizopus microsporus]|nr:hypothetical protein G6F71_003616 [Rhizopus microsporus]KAG1204928.1 hypothetical protein G6F70_000065 [Rhizopus microsporus]KAG1216462.1 hypothetical protein G6F69_000033 [Rhizopus microsporus]KAG1235504.1 hypothetical protein G6F67_002708 [Rhizopus microsporus]KAG1264290.1 hypothetical protein G6F68_004470 [Rhizopus microsporus]